MLITCSSRICRCDFIRASMAVSSNKVRRKCTSQENSFRNAFLCVRFMCVCIGGVLQRQIFDPVFQKWPKMDIFRQWLKVALFNSLDIVQEKTSFQ